MKRRQARALGELAAGMLTAWTYAAENNSKQALAALNALDTNEAFASFNGPDFYRLPRNEGRITLKRTRGKSPQRCPSGRKTTSFRCAPAKRSCVKLAITDRKSTRLNSSH